jgi:hypothetical protein
MTRHAHNLTDEQAATFLLAAIVGRDRSGFLELRHALPDSSSPRQQKFFPVGDLAAAADFALRTGQTLATYVGNAPRLREGGKTTDVGRAWILSADCDSIDSLDALNAFTPAPTLIVHTGGRTPSTARDGDGRPRAHAHWVLRDPIESPLVFALGKERLAAALGADPSFADAARIIRIPGTRWHKDHKDRPVILAEHHPDRVYRAEDVLAGLPAAPSTAPARIPNGSVSLDDPLKEIPAPEFFADLYGLAADHRGYVRCPFHKAGRERTPSLFLYGPGTRYPDRHPGWWCFGCRRGVDIYEAAALRWGWPHTPSGPAFLTIKQRLLNFYINKEVRP